MSHKVEITLAALDSAEWVGNLHGERWELTKVINLLSAVESGVLTASALVNVDDTTFTVLCTN
jgi:hypothetical protein